MATIVNIETPAVAEAKPPLAPVPALEEPVAPAAAEEETVATTGPVEEDGVVMLLVAADEDGVAGVDSHTYLKPFPLSSIQSPDVEVTLESVILVPEKVVQVASE